MVWIPIVRRHPTSGPTLTRLTTLCVAALTLSAGPLRTADAQPPRRFFVISRETNDAKDGLAVIERDGTVWTPIAKDIARGGALSPDATKYAWLENGPDEKPRITLQIQDLRKKSAPKKLPMDGRFGHCYWSRDGRELIVTTGSRPKDELVFQTSRVAADGLKSVKLPIPPTELTQDWSRDGRWLVSTSTRHAAGAKTPVITLQDVRVFHPDGTGDRVFHRLTGARSNDSKTVSVYRKSAPQFSPDSRSLLWIESGPPGSGDPPHSNDSRIMMQSLAADSPTEVMRAGDAQNLLAGAIWAPDGRSLVLHMQAGGARLASQNRFDVVDLKGKLIRSVSAKGVPSSDTRVIIHLINSR